MPQPRYYVLLNPNSGTVAALGITSEFLEELFAGHGLEAIIDADPDTPVETRIRNAIQSEADVLVAAGGDGTVTALATAIMETDKTLAILPLGTANLLARDLAIPLDIDEWIAELASMVTHAIDVCEVNGTVFLHKAVIGVIPELAAAREKIRGAGWRANIAYLDFVLRRLARARSLALEIATPAGGKRVQRVQSIAVASNAYDEGVGRFFHRDKLDTGLLTIYTLRHLNIGDAIKLAIGMLAGRWRDYEALEIESVRAVTIRSKKRRLQLMVDGEVVSLEVPLHFRIHPRALSVLAPPVADGADQPADDDPAAVLS